MIFDADLVILAKQLGDTFLTTDPADMAVLGAAHAALP